MEAMVTPPFRTEFRTAFADPAPLEDIGVMLDLSGQGCRMAASVNLRLGVMLELRIYAPGLNGPLIIEGACVQWERDQVFGLVFVQISDSEQQRLDQLIAGLMEDSGMEEEPTDIPDIVA